MRNQPGEPFPAFDDKCALHAIHRRYEKGICLRDQPCEGVAFRFIEAIFGPRPRRHDLAFLRRFANPIFPTRVLGRRVVVTPEPRMEDTGEASGRVVADHEPNVVPKTPQRSRLELGVLDHGSPERP